MALEDDVHGGSAMALEDDVHECTKFAGGRERRNKLTKPSF